MNTWQSRLLAGAAILLSGWLHGMALAGVANTDFGMLLFHGSAVAVDLALLRYTPLLLKGALCDDMQLLFWLSIALNFFGWIAYISYASPVYYNLLMWVHSGAQALRLLLVDGSNAPSFWRYLVRRRSFRRPQFHLGKAHQ